MLWIMFNFLDHPDLGTTGDLFVARAPEAVTLLNGGGPEVTATSVAVEFYARVEAHDFFMVMISMSLTVRSSWFRCLLSS